MTGRARFDFSTLLTGTGVFLAAAICALAAYRKYVAAAQFSPQTMEWTQAARYLAQSGRWGTQVVRPLLTGLVTPNADGSIPDLAHAPLGLGLEAFTLRVLKQTGAGQGVEATAMLGAGLWTVGVLLGFALFRAIFGTRGAILAALLCAFGGATLTTALALPVVPLAAVLLTTLFFALYRLDALPQAGQEAHSASPLWAAVAGIAYGLLFLAQYSALVLCPVLLWHIGRVSDANKRRRLLPAMLFGVSALLVASPFVLRTYRLTHNPLTNTRLWEAVMHTPTFPGFGLYRQANLPQTLSQYLANGGVEEIARKTTENIGGLVSQTVPTLGMFVALLFLGAALVRFPDAAVNRWRNLVYLCLALHLVGASVFLQPDEAAQITLAYVPTASAIGTAFLLAVVAARNLPRFYARAAVWGWGVVGILPGATRLWAKAPAPAAPWAAYSYLNGGTPDVAQARRAGLLLVCDMPEETAYRCGTPALWLPDDGGVIQTVEDRMKRPVVAALLTPDLPVRYANDTDTQAWRTTRDRILSLTQIVAGLKNRRLRQDVIQNTGLFYPTALQSLGEFRPSPLIERDDQYTLLFWNARVVSAAR